MLMSRCRGCAAGVFFCVVAGGVGGLFVGVNEVGMLFPVYARSGVLTRGEMDGSPLVGC